MILKVFERIQWTNRFALIQTKCFEWIVICLSRLYILNTCSSPLTDETMLYKFQTVLSICPWHDHDNIACKLLFAPLLLQINVFHWFWMEIHTTHIDVWAYGMLTDQEIPFYCETNSVHNQSSLQCLQSVFFYVGRMKYCFFAWNSWKTWIDAIQAERSEKKTCFKNVRFFFNWFANGDTWLL